MSLTAGLWTSVSGLMAHSEKMSVVSNNISNVNTVGFKSQRMDFQDFLYQSIGTTAGNAQVGRGTTIGFIMNDFSQGTLETTTNATDIAISGNGFFRVSPVGSSQSYYTRAGNFTFSKEGYLVDPNGYALQGWKIDSNTANSNANNGIVGTGSLVDIKLDTFTCAPRHTTSVTMKVNLNAADATDYTTDAGTTDPFFSLLQNWDATQDPPLGDTAYAYQSTMEVYDEAGTLHKLTVYFDRVVSDVSDGTEGESYWEYIVTMDPADDVRDFNSLVGDVSTNPNVPDNLKGLLGAGTITFNSSGQMTDTTCFVPDGTSWWGTETIDPVTGVKTADLDLQSFVAAPLDQNGYPLICANFSGSAGLSTAYGNGDYTRPNTAAEDRLISLNFGLRSTTGEWTFANTTGTGAGGLVSAADIGTQKVQATGFGSSIKRDNTATTCLNNSSYEISLLQDGYTSGDLSSVYVSSNGVLSGTYSNGVTLQLYQITIFNFSSEQNLCREGNNLFSETAESGSPTSGAAGTGTFGTTQGYSLEQSNADLSGEFVNMIVTQRGFQANSKAITTIDTMLETVISMKR